MVNPKVQTAPNTGVDEGNHTLTNFNTIQDKSPDCIQILEVNMRQPKQDQVNLPKLKDKKHSVPAASRNQGNEDLVVLGSSAEAT